MSKGGSRAAQNNRSNQMNPNNPAYQGSRQGGSNSQPALDNRSNQLNPTHAPSKGGDSGDDGGSSGAET
jgi:hypothetical protein